MGCRPGARLRPIGLPGMTGTSAMFRKLLRDEKGIGTIEYALVAMLVAVGALSAYANLGSKVLANWESSYQKISAHLG